jgi:nucleoid-associated protein YgaU
MMDPAVKTAMGLCVVLAGVCAAMLFRHDPPAAPSAPPPAASLPIPPADVAASGEGLAQPPSVAQRPATLVKPLDVEKSPPPLAARYPERDRPSGSHRGRSNDLLLPATGPRSHKIVDGDSLAVLAERYLGSAARAREIFDANRDVLPDPELLPIGVELKIPATDARQSQP